LTKVEKTRADGEWTEAKFISFVKSQLRNGSQKWPPKHKVMQAAKVARGVYECAGCGQHVPYTTKKGDGRKRNIFVDHVEPIVNPAVGFTTWDDFINNLYCDSSNLQLLCDECHTKKSAEERRISNERIKKEKYDL
jgi:5-methylcytosine-specific restriction endonuclease McrA